MLRRQPHSTRRGRVALVLIMLAAACRPELAGAAEADVVRWFSDAAAPALQAAAPTNDPGLAGRKLINRGVAHAFTQLQRDGPQWLDRVRLDLSFDPAFQPRYTLTATQPLMASAHHDASIDLHGRVVHDASGQTGGDVGLRYQGRWYDQDVTLGVQGGIEDRWLEELRRYSFGAELRLSPLEVRGTLYDDVPARPATREIGERRLDGYDLEVGAQLPFVTWARLQASRFWQTAVDGDTVTTCDRLALRLNPLSPLEIETGAQSEAEDRSWFTQLRWRIELGG
jgi:Inverse autotransporter, beta-domain